jgi:hypothetical protein
LILFSKPRTEMSVGSMPLLVIVIEKSVKFIQSPTSRDLVDFSFDTPKFMFNVDVQLQPAFNINIVWVRPH